MTKFIKKHSSCDFLTVEGNWTPQVREAKPIANLSEALAIATTLEPEGVDLYYCFDVDSISTRWDFSIPLNQAAAFFHHDN